MTTVRPAETVDVVGQLSVIDRFLPVWIIAAMVLGLGLGKAFPGIGPALDSVKLANVSLPIAIGLFWMMYPVLARVRYEAMGEMPARGRLFGASLLFNWVLGPILMFALAWLFLPDMPAYRTGLIMIGLARCIAMVLLWNTLAEGESEAAAVMVALNSVFQIVMYAGLGYFFLTVVPGWFGAGATALHISMWDIAKSVLIFLGIPLAAGALTRLVGIRAKGAEWYDTVLMARIGPLALLGLLYTIVLMFSMQGGRIIGLPMDVVRIAIPLLAYFVIIFGLAFAVSRAMGFTYAETAALSFTATGNNFELAIAVAIGTFGIASSEALAAVVGPLIEVPALVALVYVSLWLKKRWFPQDPPALIRDCG
ncbi:MAG: ACR3 family arsenite efflux transporter [Candidatus Sericytochromatia bacterium]|nr:ACR3 family arsenite efflux transporter [Candidatus Sericytochromatia bacterium]